VDDLGGGGGGFALTAGGKDKFGQTRGGGGGGGRGKPSGGGGSLPLSCYPHDSRFKDINPRPISFDSFFCCLVCSLGRAAFLFFLHSGWPPIQGPFCLSFALFGPEAASGRPFFFFFVFLLGRVEQFPEPYAFLFFFFLGRSSHEI